MAHSQIPALGGDKVEARGRWGGWLGRQPAEACSYGGEGREVGEGAGPGLDGVSVEDRDRGEGGQVDHDRGLGGQGDRYHGEGGQGDLEDREEGGQELADKRAPSHQDPGRLCSVRIKNIC